MLIKASINKVIPVILLSILCACSAERKNIFSKTYHNSTARYNAYYYAKKRINEVESILKNNMDNDFNHVLKIYPVIDTAMVSSYQEIIDDAIKKASIAIQRHKNSKWVDDSYIYVGRARHLSLEYANAIDTYKFVNTKSEDDDARHEALARLVRVFADTKEFQNAVAVQDYIKKETLNKKNKRILYLNQAHHYQLVGDDDNMLANLVKAAPLLRKKDGKGRIYFIIGQIYQKLGFDAEAFNYYEKCLSSNPDYELDFYTRLNMAQVTKLTKVSDVKNARKLLNALLRDPKNKEFKDKIYYELGEFELKQNNIDKAIDHYQYSVKSSISNSRQKGQSFLRLGEVHYDSLKNYELAQAYYDSAVQSLPTDYDNLQQIKERSAILADFVKQLKTITLQDSLLMLAALDEQVIKTKIAAIIAEEKALAAEKKKKQAEAQKRAQARRFENEAGINSTNWYFGNIAAVAQGQSEFIRIWGDIALADDWRRSNKSSSQNYSGENSAPLEEINEIKNEEEIAEINNDDNRYDELYSAIPFEINQKQECLKLIEEALYRLGNIYKFDLDEEMNAAESFEKLSQRFPTTNYLAEVWYQLYLIYKPVNQTKSNDYKNKLLRNFPESIFAKLISNPNYREESTAANEKLKIEYQTAYKFYANDQLDTARYIINEALKKYDETAYTANIKLLKIMITGKTEDITVYQYELGDFIKSYPEHEITTYAEKLLEASRTYQEKKQKRLGAQYVKYLEQWHYFVLVYETKSGLADLISNKVNEFNNGLNIKLNTSSLILDDEYSILLVSDFNDMKAALSYFKKFDEGDPINEKIRDSKFYKFVITKDNFNIFYQSKDLPAYLSFFEKNYLYGFQ